MRIRRVTESEVCSRKINIAAIYRTGLEGGQLERRRPGRRPLQW